MIEVPSFLGFLMRCCNFAFKYTVNKIIYIYIYIQLKKNPMTELSAKYMQQKKN